VSLAATASLGAVTMAPELGRRTRELLGVDPPVPVISHPKTGRPWVFLVGPNRGRGHSIRSLADLEQRGVRLLAAGQRVWLPMSDCPTGWFWISPPRDAMSLPSRTAVLNAARSALGGVAPASPIRC
jgi:hypothetical protein